VNHYPEAIVKLIHSLSTLPGIGKKTAERLALHILHAPDHEDKGVICVVENPTDMAAIEKSGAFSGVYHILGGALSPIDGIGPGDIRLAELFRRTRGNEVREIILATRTNVEGEATAAYIRGKVDLTKIKITRIASGIPMGGDLQYVDPLTMQKAMEKRYGV
jgi:recombination protein RecR